MKPVFQTKFGGADAPASEQGNCMAACLATIFECALDDVPDFTGSITSGGWFFQLQRWLKQRNLSILMLLAKPCDVPAGYAMCAVKSFTLPSPDDGHMVVVRNGLLVHDPNPRNQGRPWEDYEVTEYWAFTCVDPAQIVDGIASAVAHRVGPKALRDRAVAKCRSCRYGEYQPKDPGRVAYHPARIRCSEGIFGALGPKQAAASLPGHTYWYSIGGLARAQSRTRGVILTCEFWEAQEQVCERRLYPVDYTTDTALHPFVGPGDLCAGCGEHRNWHKPEDQSTVRGTTA